MPTGSQVIARLGRAAAIALLALSLCNCALAAPLADARPSSSQSSRGAEIRDAFKRLLLLRDYNTRVVLAGTFVMGVSSGVVGVFLLLRKRALLADVVSHAALPGIACAFLILTIAGRDGKWLPGLLVGAAAGGVVGVLCTSAIRRWTRIKDDAALAVVLSVFFGIGVALMSAVQQLPDGSQAGLAHFIYGKAASMMARDVWLIAVAAALALIVCVLFAKEFSAIAFDERFSASEGWPVFGLDLLIMILVVLVTVVGLQSVGLLLVVALLIVPAAAARFWTERLTRMLWISGLLGGFSAVVGVAISAVFPRVPTGAVIVLVGSGLFLVSMFLGSERGVARRMLTLWRVRRRAGQQHLLRAIYEKVVGEQASVKPQTLLQAGVQQQDLQPMRSWSAGGLRRLMRWAQRNGLLTYRDQKFWLTEAGAQMAARIVRNHRLWELYLIHFADIAPSHVDRDADDIEHVLDSEMLAMLEARMGTEFPETPPSPHEITSSSTTASATDSAELSSGRLS